MYFCFTKNKYPNFAETYVPVTPRLYWTTLTSRFNLLESKSNSCLLKDFTSWSQPAIVIVKQI